MKRILAVLALACAFLLFDSSGAAAQCNEACVRLVAPAGPIGWDCIPGDSASNCDASATRCKFTSCYNAMVVDITAGALAVADICSGNVAVHSIAHAPKPRIAAKLRAQRGTATIAIAHKARVPNAG